MDEDRHIPPDCDGMLRRPRLVDAATHENRDITVLVAGGGYGKSVLMAQLHDELEGHGVWYRFEDSDHDPVRLINRLEGALRDIRGGEHDILAQGTGGASAASEHHRIVEFSNGLYEPGPPLNLFFDDFHLANHSAALMSFFELLLANIPEQVRVFIAGREAPALPLGRMRIQRRLNELNTTDLRFTLREASEFLGGDDDAISRRAGLWFAESGGWTKGLALLKEACRQPVNDAEAVLNNAAALAGEYYRSEVFSDIDEDLDWFLTRASVFGELNADICDEVLYDGRPGTSAHMLCLAEKRHLLIRRTAKGDSYRFHDWLRAYLRERLSGQADSHEVARLHLGYARAVAARGRFARAISHFTAAGQPEQAADLLEAQADDLLKSGKVSVLAHWLSRLPARTVNRRPELKLLQARIAMQNGDTNRADRYLDIACRGSGEQGGQHLFRCELLASDLAAARGELDASVRYAETARSSAAETRERSEAFCRLARGHFEQGRSAEAANDLKAAATEADKSGSAIVRASVALAVASIGLLEGRFTATLPELLHLQKDANDDAETSFRATVLTAHAQYYTADYPAALDTVRQAMTLARRRSDRLAGWKLTELMGRTFFCLGDKAAAREHLKEARRRLARAGIAGAAACNHKGVLHRRERRLRVALSAHEEALALSRQNGSVYLETASLVNIGAIKIRQAPQDGDGGLAEAATRAREAGYLYQHFQALFHLAWLALRQDRRKDAIVLLGQAISEAAANGYDHFIIQESRTSPECLKLAVAEGIEDEYMMAVCHKAGKDLAPGLLPLLASKSAAVRKRALLAASACGGSAALRRIGKLLRDSDKELAALAAEELEKHRQADPDPGRLLTAKEQQVLSLLAAGLSNAHIGDRLFISEGTVKSHVGRIFRKLGLSRRVQAARYFNERREGAGREGAGGTE